MGIKKSKDEIDDIIQAEKSNVASQLASSVAHEVRNPLAVIMQCVNYLENKLPAEEKDISDVLAMLKSSIKKINKIINLILDFSRPTVLNLQPEDLNLILEKSLNSVKSQIKIEHNIEMIKEIKTDIPRVLADKDKLEQVFVNILVNAVQAMPEGGKIVIRSYFKQVVTVEFEDTGTGISEEHINKIFDPFFTAQKGGGAGLGLSISRKIIDMHKGLINVESQAGKGTKVSVILRISEDT